MAGCCPPAQSPIPAGAADSQTAIQDNQPVRGESFDCYMATATNPTGKHDDATDNVANRIENTTIPLDANGAVNVTFRVQKAAGARVPNDWSMEDADSGDDWANSTVSFSSNGETATFIGTFSPSDLGKTFKVIVAANDDEGEIDNRGFNFAPAKASGGDSIQFIHPLPGAIVTSPFGLRKHPVTGVQKPHGGCDFALAGHVTSDVLAAADGEVIFTGFEAGGAGNYVKIKHLNSSGKHLCTSVYMHLATIYVTTGQKVPAGQKIGYEGNTGIGTGAHLHFECRLPNDTKIDPLPLIRGSVSAARETNPDNSAVESSIETKTNNSVLTPANVDAKQSNCAPFGPGYPNPQTAVPPPASAPTNNDPFELAWNLTLMTEVSGWHETPPTVPETLQGLIDTTDHKRHVGYVNHPADPGGETKFGVSARANKSIVISTLPYQPARDVAYSKYWQGTTAGSLAASKPRTAIAAFNFGYLAGPGGLASALRSANIGSLDDSASMNALCSSMKEYLFNLATNKPSLGVFKKGWGNRTEMVRSYCAAAAV